MSNLGQGLAAVAGGVVGFFIGGPTGAAYGFQLGLLAGSALFPTQLPGVSGPRLEDQRTTTSEVGSPLAIVYGTYAVAGTVMDLGELEEVSESEEVGGKGAPSQEQTTYSYFQPIAIGLCEPIDGLLRVWENGELVYDIREDETSDGQAEVIIPGGLFGNRGAQPVSPIVAQSRNYQQTFTLYKGDEDQLPDPTLEAIHGVGEVPAFRGLAYIVYHRRQLLEKQGLRHPNFKFEVVRNGQFECVEVTEYSNEVLYDWLSVGNPVNPKNKNIFGLPGGGTTESMSEAMEEFRAARIVNSHVTRIGWPSIAYLDAQNLIVDGVVADSYPVLLGGHPFSNQAGVQANLFFGIEPYNVVVHPYGVDAFLQAPGTVVYTQFGNYLTLSQVYPGPPGYDPGDPYPYDILQAYEAGTHYVWSSQPVTMQVERRPNAPTDPCENQPNATLPGFCVVDGYLIAKGEWTLVNFGFETDEQFHVLRKLSNGNSSSNPTRYPLNPCVPLGSADDTEAFWTAAYNAAVAAGEMPMGMTYVADNSGDGTTTYPQEQDFAWVRASLKCTGASDGISLAEIITDICARVGITRIDVSELATKMVHGFAITRVMPARSAIEPLKSVGFFDIVESPPELCFRVRGRAPVATLTENDLGVHEEGSTPPPLVTIRKLQDVELPRQVRVHYISPSRDYELGEQQSQTRITTDATNDVDIEVPVCLDDTEAKRIAEVLWADAWRSRWVHQFSTDQRWLALEPADVVLLPIEGLLERLRIVSVDDAIPLLRKFESCRDDDGSYVSYAVAEVPDRPPNEIRILAPTELILLDIPALRDADNDAGVYAAARSLMRDAVWHGAAVRYSKNEGETFIDLLAIGTEAIIGEVVTAAGPGTTTTWDEENSLVVQLLNGSLEDRTEEDVMAGANGAAVGRHGRWELLQFVDTEEVAEDRFSLTRLLRGRKGTEHYIGTMQAGDQFVLLSGPGVVRVSLDSSEIGIDRIYKTVSVGAAAGTGIEQTFATQGVALEPYSPAHLAAALDEDGDMLISWVRRGRLGRELTSGVDIPLSEAFERYEIDILTPAGAVLRTVTVNDAQELLYTYAQQLADFTVRDVPMLVRVYQISEIVGRGTPAELLTDTSIALEPVLPPIDYPQIYARITFGGAPDGDEDVVVRGIYAPKNAAGTNIEVTILGAGKDSPDDYALELYTYLNGLGLPATANVSQPTVDSVQVRAVEGDQLSLYAYAAHPQVTFDYDTQYDSMDPLHDDTWIGGTYRIPLPVQNGVKQQITLDLYEIIGGFVDGAAEQSNNYRTGGAAVVRFTVYALDYDTNKTFPVPYLGQVVQINWAAPNNISDLRQMALGDIVAANGLPKPAYTLLAQYADFVGWSVVGGRQVVYITMKYGYWAAVDVFSASWQPNGTHPSGYDPGTQEAVEGVMRYPSGAKWMAGVSFFHFNDATFYASGLGGWASGQTIEITLDANTFSYTIDGTEATALNTTDNSAGSDLVTTMNAIMDDLETQIETSGDYVVLHELYSNGQYKDWRIERTAANTAVTFSGQVTGYDLTIVTETFDEDSSP